MAVLSPDIIKALEDPTTARVLTTTRRDGTPHAVFADWLVAPDPTTLAYLEPFEVSRTSANLLHHLWDKRRVSIAVCSADRRIRCEISGLPRQLVSEGPLWDALLGMAWREIPDANPSGLWLITPEEVTDQCYPAAAAAMAARRQNFALWWSYLGTREPDRGLSRAKGGRIVDVKQIQEMFRAEDSADLDTVRQFLHPDLVVNLIGVAEADSPLSRDGFLRFLESVVADRASRGERIEHIPSAVKIEGDFVAIRGLLRTCRPGEADQFDPYMDILKLSNGRIAEYTIAFGI